MTESHHSPIVADLRAALELLNGGKVDGRSMKSLRRVQVAHSCLVDIRQAESCIHVLDQLRENGAEQSAKMRTIESSLLFNAAHLYARALWVTAKLGSRGAIDVHSRLPAELKPIHDMLGGVRKRALAHVYYSQSYTDNEWHVSSVIAVKNDKGWMIAAQGQQIQYSESVHKALQSLLPFVITLIEGELQERIQGLQSGMIEVFGLPAVLSALEVSPFDAEGYFGIQGSVEAYQNHVPGESRSGFKDTRN